MPLSRLCFSIGLLPRKGNFVRSYLCYLPRKMQRHTRPPSHALCDTHPRVFLSHTPPHHSLPKRLCLSLVKPALRRPPALKSDLFFTNFCHLLRKNHLSPWLVWQLLTLKTDGLKPPLFTPAPSFSLLLSLSGLLTLVHLKRQCPLRVAPLY